MQPEIVVRPSFVTVGSRYRGKNQHNEIPQLWREFVRRMHAIQSMRQPVVSYGIMNNYDMSSGEFDYYAACEVTNGAEAPPEMVVKVVPAQTYAAFRCTLPTLQSTFAKIENEWLPKSGYRHADGPELEVYDEHFTPDDSDAEMFVYIPVEAAS